MTPSASQVSTNHVRWAGVVLLLAVCALLAAFSVWRYYQVVEPMLGDWNAWHRTTMKGEMGAPLRYRLISFLLPRARSPRRLRSANERAAGHSIRGVSALGPGCARTREW